VGDLVPFRKRRKRWTRPEDYGRVLPTETWQGRPAPQRRWRAVWRGLRWWLALVVLAALWVLWRDAIAYDPPAFLEGRPVAVSGPFTRCGTGRGPQCVVDGDTLKLGERTVRLVGIDAPEVRARCPAEAAGAGRATAALLVWANAGPFELVPRLDGPTDKYGRELMTARRGSVTAAQALLAAGVVRAYAGEARAGWC